MTALNGMINYEITRGQTTNFRIEGENSARELAHAAARPFVGIMQLAGGLANVVEGLFNYPSEYSRPGAEEDMRELVNNGGKDLLKGVINVNLGILTTPIVAAKAIEQVARNAIQNS